MRRPVYAVLCLLLAVSLLSGCRSVSNQISNGNMPLDKGKVSTNVVQGSSRFAFDIFRQLNKEDKGASIFISPLSISTALSMTYQGARTTTRDSMTKALGYEGIDIEDINESYKSLLEYLQKCDSKIELNIGNSIWIRDGQAIKKDFLAVNKDVFSAQVSSLDFSKGDSADKINGWISDSTKGKIPKMIEPPIPQNIVMYLINAIYFKGQWTEKFDKKSTFSSKFYMDNRNVKEVMMMSRKGTVEYGQADDFKAVRLPYGNGKISMYCILPDEDTSINGFIDSMDLNKWNQIRESISEREDIILQIPRFKMEYGIKELNDSLTKLGMGETFSDRADFSGIRESISISRVLHKAVVEVNEEGSEAAGVTVVEIKETAAMEPVAFIANRPFVFVIADDQSGTILFMGKLSDIE